MSDKNIKFTETQQHMGGIGSGGAREGAGRKATDGARSKISVRIPVWLVDMIREEADRRKVSTSRQITDLLIKGAEK